MEEIKKCQVSRKKTFFYIHPNGIRDTAATAIAIVQQVELSPKFCHFLHFFCFSLETIGWFFLVYSPSPLYTSADKNQVRKEWEERKWVRRTFLLHSDNKTAGWADGWLANNCLSHHAMFVLLLLFAFFLSAAQPIGQGPERVLVLVLVVAVGTHFISTKVHFFRVCKVANFFGCVKSITFAERGV